MLIACALVYIYKFSGNEAISYVRMRRPGSIQTRRQVQFVRDFAAYLEPAHYIFHPRAIAAPSREAQDALSRNDGLLASGLPLDHYIRRQRILLLTWEQSPLEKLPRVLWACARALTFAPKRLSPTALSSYLQCRLSETAAREVAHMCAGLNCGDWARVAATADGAAVLTVLRRFLISAADALVVADEVEALFQQMTSKGLRDWHEAVSLRARKALTCTAAIVRATQGEGEGDAEANSADQRPDGRNRRTLLREALALHFAQLCGDPHRRWSQVEGVQQGVAQLVEDDTQDALSKVALELRDPLKALHQCQRLCRQGEGGAGGAAESSTSSAPPFGNAAISRDVLHRQSDVVLACVILEILRQPDAALEGDLYLSQGSGQQPIFQPSDSKHTDDDLISAVLPTPPSPALQERLRAFSIRPASELSAGAESGSEGMASSLRAHDIELSDYEDSTDDDDDDDDDSDTDTEGDDVKRS